VLVDGKPYRTIWRDHAGVVIIDQTLLPHRFVIVRLEDVDAAANAISTMQVRGAPLIGATAAYGLALAIAQNPGDTAIENACERLLATRPTAINLKWALDRIRARIREEPENKRASVAFAEADRICDEDVDACRSIGEHGLEIIADLYRANPGRPVNILTHCNAGWLATLDWGTATSPVYQAQVAKIPVHVWVDETRPRNQGAALTCYELGHQQIPHTLITDNAGGHLMQHGQVDMVITGTDRTARNGDVANKIGTYLKALAARDNDIPFYVALPSSTLDWAAASGKDIPIENRDAEEVTHIHGLDDRNELSRVRISPWGSEALNPAFDVTPANLVTGLITERGITDASELGLRKLFPESNTNDC
jgi:methylthioribose-1-phosphate isomerase